MERHSVLVIQKYFLIPQSQIDSKLHHISLKCQFAIELTVTFLDGKKKIHLVLILFSVPFRKAILILRIVLAQL